MSDAPVRMEKANLTPSMFASRMIVASDEAEEEDDAGNADSEASYGAMSTSGIRFRGLPETVPQRHTQLRIRSHMSSR